MCSCQLEFVFDCSGRRGLGREGVSGGGVGRSRRLDGGNVLKAL